MNSDLLQEPILHPQHEMVPPTWEARVPHFLDILEEGVFILALRRWKAISRRELYRLAAILDEFHVDMEELWGFGSWMDFMRYCVEALDGLVHVSLSASDAVEFDRIRGEVFWMAEIADQTIAAKKK